MAIKTDSITARARIVPADSGTTRVNMSNITDDDDSTYAKIKVSPSSKTDIIVSGFDFSSIPDNAVITKISLKSLVGLDNKISCILFAVRKYVNGVYEGDLSTTQTPFGEPKTAITNEIVEEPPGEIFSNCKVTDINQSWTNSADYTGIALYIRYKSANSVSTYYAYPRYFDMTIDYEYDDATYYTVTTAVSPAGAGTVTPTQEVEEGGEFTIAAIPNDGYKFSHWAFGDSVLSYESTVTFSDISSDAVFTAVFIVNKIVCDTSKQPTILIDTQVVKAILIDTTKVYG